MAVSASGDDGSHLLDEALASLQAKDRRKADAATKAGADRTYADQQATALADLAREVLKRLDAAGKPGLVRRYTNGRSGWTAPHRVWIVSPGLMMTPDGKFIRYKKRLSPDAWAQQEIADACSLAARGRGASNFRAAVDQTVSGASEQLARLLPR